MVLTSFSDVFKSSFLETMTSFSVLDSSIALISALIVGFMIYLIYKRTFMDVLYSESFNLSLVLLTLLTTFVILAVTSNVVLSLGMVGALSIVRFRTAIKDPLDLVFLFWAIGAGIIMGAGLLPLGFFGSLIIGFILILRGRKTGNHVPYLAILRCDHQGAEDEAFTLLNQHVDKLRLKSKVTSSSERELIYEVLLREQDTHFVNTIASIEGVQSIQLVSYNGDYAG